MDAPETFWIYRGARWLWIALALMALSAFALWADVPVTGRSGGSWLGYGLGSVCFVLMLWLMWLGVRRRTYAGVSAPLRGWLSAHVYLGLALVVLVPLHSAFQFGWNVHTLAYALIVLVVASGLGAAVAYTRVPELLTRNRSGEKLAALLARIDELDSECTTLALDAPDAVAKVVRSSVMVTRIGGGVTELFRGGERRCATARCVAEIARVLPTLDDATQSAIEPLLEFLNTKREILLRVRRELRLRALMDVWLYLHVPLAAAAMAAVLAHVFLVFYYR